MIQAVRTANSSSAGGRAGQTKHGPQVMAVHVAIVVAAGSGVVIVVAVINVVGITAVVESKGVQGGFSRWEASRRLTPTSSLARMRVNSE